MMTRTGFFFTFLLLGVMPTVGWAGLKEERAIAGFKKTEAPKIKAAINKTCGSEIKLDLQMEGLSEDHISGLATNFFNGLTAALKDVCKDASGKKAVKGKIQKIVVKHENVASCNVSFEGNSIIYALGGACSSSDAAWFKSFLENNL